MKKVNRIKERVIQIETTEEQFFIEFVSIMRPFMNAQIKQWMKRDGIDKESDLLNGKKQNDCFYFLAEGDQLRIFSMFLYFNDKFSDLSDEDKVAMLNDYDVKLRIKQGIYKKKMGSTKNTNYFRGYLQALRNNMCLVDIKTDNKKMINPLFEIFPAKKFRLVFEFDIKDRSEKI